MKSMRSLTIPKVFGSRRSRGNTESPGPTQRTPDPSRPSPAEPVPGETPEDVITRCVKEFIKAGTSGSSLQQHGDEVTLLPPIVEAAESSPGAAAECARLIRKYLHRDNWSLPSYQYNAIMLLRILADNPGPTFTRNMDKKFVETARDILRNGRDLSVRQMLMETLDSLETKAVEDPNLAPTVEMWHKEREKAYKVYPRNQFIPGPGIFPAPVLHSGHRSSHRSLPDPVELAARLEEARTSAKLLEQVVASTPPAEVLSNELIREFADRCNSAARSVENYMKADSPAPDNDTMESLIDTNEQLQTALRQHQRAVLNARKHLGLGERGSDPNVASPDGRPPARSNSQAVSTVSGVSALSGREEAPLPKIPGRKAADNGKGKAAAGGPSRSGSGTPANADLDDPFRDPDDELAPYRAGGSSSRPGGSSSALNNADDESDKALPFESYHPGFKAASNGAGGSGKAKAKAAAVDSDDEDAYGATPKKR